MWPYLIKTILSAIIIVLVTETAKHSGLIGGLIKSLPLISVISFILLYLETQNTEKVASLSVGTFWFVLPTLPPFLLFAYLLQHHVGFWQSLSIMIVAMLLCYGLTILLLNRMGMHV